MRQWGGVFQSGNVHAVIDRVHGNALFYNQDRWNGEVTDRPDRVIADLARPLGDRDALAHEPGRDHPVEARHASEQAARDELLEERFAAKATA